MKRVIVDYSKLTSDILNLLVEKFPDGYDDSDIIRFKNHKDETIEAVEVRTEDTIYLVKISTKLAYAVAVALRETAVFQPVQFRNLQRII